MRGTSLFTPEHFLARTFEAKAVADGLVIRRKIKDIQRFAGLDAFMAEVERRGFQAMENQDHIFVFCNPAPVRRLV